MVLDFEITECVRKMTNAEYNPSLHTAQVSWYITLNSTKEGVTDYIWFGLPLFDARSDGKYLDGFRGIDKGTETGTGMLIYSVQNKNFLTSPVSVGKKVSLDFNILPSIKEALIYAQTNYDFLTDHTVDDFSVGSMNLGWEVPGTFNCGMKITKIGMQYEEKEQVTI